MSRDRSITIRQVIPLPLYLLYQPSTDLFSFVMVLYLLAISKEVAVTTAIMVHQAATVTAMQATMEIIILHRHRHRSIIDLPMHPDHQRKQRHFSRYFCKAMEVSILM